MNRRMIITTSAVVVLMVGTALFITYGSGAMDSILDAVAVIIVVTVLSLHARLRERTLHS